MKQSLMFTTLGLNFLVLLVEGERREKKIHNPLSTILKSKSPGAPCYFSESLPENQTDVKSSIVYIYQTVNIITLIYYFFMSHWKVLPWILLSRYTSFNRIMNMFRLNGF